VFPLTGKRTVKVRYSHFVLGCGGEVNRFEDSCSEEQTKLLKASCLDFCLVGDKSNKII